MRMPPWVLIVCAPLLVGGCREADSPQASQREAEALREEYTQKLYEKVLPNLDPAADDEVQRMVYEEADAIFRDVYGGHEDLLRRRARDALAAMDEAPPIEEDQYDVVASETFPSWEEWCEAQGAEIGSVAKELWRFDVEARAEMAVGALMPRVMDLRSYGLRVLLDRFAEPVWEMAGRDTDGPRLVKRMGPEVLIVDLRESDNVYDVTAVRWLRRR